MVMRQLESMSGAIVPMLMTRAPERGEVGGFEAVVGHDRREARGEAYIGDEVLDNQVGHVVVERVGEDMLAG
jgi:hypothetical protein